MTHLIEKITKMTQESQNKELRLFAKVDITTKLKILSFQKQQFHILRKNYTDEDNAVLTLASILLAIKKIASEIDDINMKAIQFKVKQQKNCLKREKLLERWSIVKTLKSEQNLSFRQISEYFKKYHKIEVSYSTIFNMWNEIENNNNYNKSTIINEGEN
ncbi:MAG: hypothetical protein U9N59_06855 [Campylobacterota bacterium]|nr:hypothetical protein [Campylobacterota bacterium]